MKLKVTPRARADFRNIQDWIGSDNPRAAREVVGRIRQTAALLTNFPQLGRAGRVDGTREFPVTGLSYTLVYEVVGDELRLLTILHQSRNYP